MRNMKSIVNEFKEFALKGSVVDLAVGIIIGTAFNKIVNSLVSDIIMPPLGLFLGGVNFSELFINLSRTSYQTLEEAQTAGAPTINYGIFLDHLISFLLIGFSVFLVVKLMNKIRRDNEKESSTQKK